ncbi:MAG: terpene cyclase/mutase family protein [Candidatus Riflebacteria bacterium]|nr:terpene cyclase/mutase family protein [Candidatus Riflebacteria bacterium]
MKDLTLAPILQFVLEERFWENIPLLEEMAKFLPAVPCAGIEFPLTQNGCIDLQQRIKSVSEVDKLKLFFKSNIEGHFKDVSQWTSILNFCENELLSGNVDDIWLELDNKKASGQPPISVFVRLPTALSPSQCQTTVNRTLCGLGSCLSDSRKEILTQCIEALPPTARLCHLGLMLGRPGTPIRLIIEGIPCDEFVSYLNRTGWQGSKTNVQQQIDALFTHVDRIRLALTIGDTLMTTLGLECFVGQPWNNDPRWKCVFDMLQKEHLCTEQQRCKVLAWPGALTPFSVKGTWPHSLMLSALTRSPQEIGWIDCRISHIKITHYDNEPPVAKVYLGFIEVWEKTKINTNSSAASLNTFRSSNKLSEAVEAALAFLLTCRAQSGWWQDYDGFSEGLSDEWVTAYVGCMLTQIRDSQAEKAARRAWSLLANRQRAGWGWNYLQSGDADSTIWALRLASQLGEINSGRAKISLEFLRRHINSSGGISTYLPENREDWGNQENINPTWYDTHTCVTAAAANLVALGKEPMNYIRKNQQTAGNWESYWWKSPVYATAQAVDAIKLHGIDADRGLINRAIDWIRNFFESPIEKPDPISSPFDSALALCILLSVPGKPCSLTEKITNQILASQNLDGSWNGSAILSFPNALKQTINAFDNRRTITTATVLRAIQLLCVSKNRN